MPAAPRQARAGFPCASAQGRQRTPAGLARMAAGPVPRVAGPPARRRSAAWACAETARNAAACATHTARQPGLSGGRIGRPPGRAVTPSAWLRRLFAGGLSPPGAACRASARLLARRAPAPAPVAQARRPPRPPARRAQPVCRGGGRPGAAPVAPALKSGLSRRPHRARLFARRLRKRQPGARRWGASVRSASAAPGCARVPAGASAPARLRSAARPPSQAGARTACRASRRPRCPCVLGAASGIPPMLAPPGGLRAPRLVAVKPGAFAPASRCGA